MKIEAGSEAELDSQGEVEGGLLRAGEMAEDFADAVLGDRWRWRRADREAAWPFHLG